MKSLDLIPQILTMKTYNQIIHEQDQDQLNSNLGYLTRSLKKDTKNIRFCVIDIETYLNSDKLHIPYAICLTLKNKAGE
jgi:hypothetical protein